MRRKLVEQTPPPKCRKKGWWTIVQDIEGITVLNIFSDGGLKTRHCIDITHKDYATLHPSGEWSRRKIEWSYDIETQWMYNYCDSRNFKNFRASSADVAFLRERFPKRSHSYYDDSTVFAVISKTEYEWAAGRRENTEIRRCAKVQETMSRIPPLPEDVEKWFYDAALGEDFAIRTDAAGVYMCTACHGKAPLDAWRMPDGKPARNNDMVACPHCGSSIRLKRRRKDVFAYSDFIIVQPIDDTMSVIKVCNGRILIMGDRKDVSVREKIRILSGRGENAVDRKNIYYQQYGGDFDNKSNPHNHRISSRQYMYPVGITEALSGTKAGMWSALFTDFAAAGLKLAYGTLITCFDPDVHALMEMLYRGRFYKLLAEESGRINDMEEWVPDCFDILFVAAGAGETYGGLLGFDSYEQDYFGIGCSEAFAEDEAKKKLKQMTKDELIAAVRQCFRIYSAYIGLRNRYDSLKAAKGKYETWQEDDNITLLGAWARDGLTQAQIAKNMGIALSTLKEWIKKYPAISAALKKGKELADYEMENALYKKGTGYTVTLRKPIKLKEVEYDNNGKKISEKEKIEYAEVEEYIPPDVTAQIFWLKNRKPETWRDKREAPPEKEEYEDDGFITALKQTAKEVFDGTGAVETMSDKEREAADEADKTADVQV